MLRDLKFKPVYRSGEDNLLEDFYIPALSVSVSYQRAVGFFSATMLSYAGQGLSAFVANRGTMQLVVGGELDAEDEAAIRRGYDLREVAERLGPGIIREIDGITDALCYRRLEVLSNLIATSRLSIKIAVRPRGMYHEKIGILKDAAGDMVVFEGSANETSNALIPGRNFECINVFPCWQEELRGHYEPYLIGFNKLWANEEKDTIVVEFPEAAKRRFVRIAEKCRVPSPEAEVALYKESIGADLSDVAETLTPAVPELLGGEPFVLGQHQRYALNAWRAHEWRGIFEHATGSGKTITALYGAVRILEATNRLLMVVAVPYQNLADQWVTVMAQFGLRPLQCYESSEAWRSVLSEQSDLFVAGAQKVLCVVVVNRTLQSSVFQEWITRMPGDCLMFVGDECHHHSSPSLLSALPAQAEMRLGLSATPQHYADAEANRRMSSYYGEIVSTFTLADALAAGVITPYDYHVQVITLTPTEADEYIVLSKKISSLSAQGSEDGAGTSPQNAQLKALLMKRARLLGSASEKLVTLRRLLGNTHPHPLALFYCGDGSTEDDDDDAGEATRAIDQVTLLLYEMGWKCSRFTARESRKERERLLIDFRVGAIHALVAIHCLDEGIDVPACRTAYLLASARNPRQFVQRRGRILRRSPGKDFATIYDFVVKLPSEGSAGDKRERDLLEAELSRVAEFTKLARNSTDAVKVLLPLMKEYDLAHLLV